MRNEMKQENHLDDILTDMQLKANKKELRKRKLILFGLEMIILFFALKYFIGTWMYLLPVYGMFIANIFISSKWENEFPTENKKS